MKRPAATSGLRHIALFVKDLEACAHFYIEILGMEIEWQPDADDLFLTSGNDNLALHRGSEKFDKSNQRLDHIGFIINTPELVDEWYQFLSYHNVPLQQPPRTHRDGARSFYCYDPAGVTVQLIFHPPIS